MLSLSRRQLAQYAVNQLLKGEPPQKVSKHLAAALVSMKKQKEAGLLLDDIAHVLESQGLLAQAVVTSAHSLTAALHIELLLQIKEVAKVDDAVINEEIDKDVIGGLRIETANHTWDKTIARRLADIKGGI